MGYLRRRAFRLLVMGAVALLTACGGSDEVATADPAGRVIPGTGPVADQADATQRLLTQYLGLAATRQGDGTVVGTGSDPFVNLYRASDGPLSRGTMVSDSGPDLTPFALNRAYYLYWLDPNPPAQLGHLCYLLFVDPTDGRIIETPVEFDPRIGDLTPLLFLEDKRARIVYGHRTWFDLLAADAERGVSRQELGGEQNARGLVVGGHYDFSGEADFNNVADYVTEVTGDFNAVDQLVDRKDDRINKDELAEALQKASEDLGVGDKFYFVISSHASKSGRVRIGTDLITWTELCSILDDNVTAQHLNLIISTCYSGLADASFAGWDDLSDKGVRWVTATDDEHPSYADAFGAFGIRCALRALTAALAGAREDGELTVAELEQAMADLETDLTGEEIRQKICDYYQPRNPEWWADFEQDDGEGDKVRPQGDPKTGGFGPAPPSGNEILAPQAILDFLERLRQARLAEDPVQLRPLYSPTYLFDGQDFEAVTTPQPGFDFVDLRFNHVVVADGDIIADGHHEIVVAGSGRSSIESVQDVRWRFDLVEGDDGPLIRGERQVTWTQVDRGGPLGLQTAPPGFPVIELVTPDPGQDVLGPFGFVGGIQTIEVGATITFTGLERQFGGTPITGAFASLAGETVQLERQGPSNVYRGTMRVPALPGRWVLSISASTRLVDGQTGDFVSAASGRSFEVIVG